VRLGIDFGTTHTVVAYCDRGNYPLLGFLDTHGDSYDWFPSLAARHDDRLDFGFIAETRAEEGKATLLRSLKRQLRSSTLGGELPSRLELAPLELVTRFLRALRDQIRARLSLSGSEPLQAVIAVPANTHSAQRFATLHAFREAGFEVLAMLNEPSAAGFEYTHRHRNTFTAKREHVIVYDLGGGTFDVSLVRIQDKRHEIVATAGDGELGGDDFDSVLLDMLAGQLRLHADDLPSALRATLLERCRHAKERLHPSSRKIVLEAPELRRDEIVVSVSEYYTACEPLVQRTLDILQSVVGTTDDSELAGIYVVGGASALPCISRALRERYGRRVHRSPYPFAACAIGLAIAADADSKYELHDRFARHLGVFREARAGRDIAFDVILDKRAALPPRLETTRVYRAAHNVGHFRFVECSDVDADGTPRGDLTPYQDVLFPFDRALQGVPDLRDAPIERIAHGPLIEERYLVDESGAVSVTLRDVESGFERAFRLDHLQPSKRPQRPSS
jgi:molecular chaperone DnaK (HSP70)